MVKTTLGSPVVRASTGFSTSSLCMGRFVRKAWAGVYIARRGSGCSDPAVLGSLSLELADGPDFPAREAVGESSRVSGFWHSSNSLCQEKGKLRSVIVGVS